MYRLLIINPGSTSTKIAVYEDENQVFLKSISHSAQELLPFEHVIDQAQFRTELVRECLRDARFSEDSFDAIIARGGILPPIRTGGYAVNDDMLWQLRNKPAQEHASNLGAVIADAIGRPHGTPCYIYDAVSADEMDPLLTYTGLPELRRRGHAHNLNHRACAHRFAETHGKTLGECNLIVAHLGGGASIALFREGRIVDVVNNDDGPFTPERAGALPTVQLLELAMDEKTDCRALYRRVMKEGGLIAYFGTNSTQEIERRMEEGDEKAGEIYRAMAVNIAKRIGSLAPVVRGRLDAVILTGGIARSKKMTAMISEYVSYLAPVVIYPGENEMYALALGGLRILRGEETCNTFVHEP